MSVIRTAVALLVILGSSLDARSQDRERRLERWRESLELDHPREVLDDGLAAVTGTGALARDGEAIELVCRALSSTGGAQRAKEIAAAAAVEPATQAWISVARARLALQDDDLAQTEALLLAPRSATQKDMASRMRHPENSHAWLLLGRAWMRAGRASDAEPVLTRFLEMAPLDAEAPAAWHMLAQAALARGAMDVANERRTRADQSGQWQGFYRARRLQVREAPKEPLPRLGLAQLWLSAGELSRAKSVLDELLAMSPDFCRGWEALGETLRRSGDRAAARSAYDRALTCDPSLAEALFDRGMLAASEALWEDARRDLARLVDGPAGREAKYLTAHLGLARALLRLNDAAGAEKRYARYRELGGAEPLE
jgi:tetratricopeptide (TPR) repeat protein